MSFPEEEWQEGETSAEKYRAFLLRCWQEADAGTAGELTWRFTLVQLGQGQTKKGFASLEDLVAYLRVELQEVRPHAPSEAHEQDS